MVRFSGFLLFFSILLTLLTTSVSQTVVESSLPLSQTVAESKITIGSSISAAATITDSSNSSFWSSPSGIFSFGFYPLNSYYQEYIIGIWINNNPIRKTLVWSINRDDTPLSIATSLLLNHEGKFIIQFSNGTEERPLFHQADSLLSSPISYASILDNGNLVFYNSNSTIIWNSFSYPTDTILPGQTLHPEQRLVSSVSESDRSSGVYTMIMKNDGNLMIYTHGDEDIQELSIQWTSETKKKNGSPVELKLDSTGHLYLGDWNGLIRKNLSNGSIDSIDSIDRDEQQQKQDKVIIYRATLGNDGVFRLYLERIGCDACDEKSSMKILWDTEESIRFSKKDKIFLVSFVCILVLLLLSPLVWTCVRRLYRRLDLPPKFKISFRSNVSVNPISDEAY